MDFIDLDHFNLFPNTAITEYAALLQCLPARLTNADHEPRLTTANQLAPSSPLLQPGAGVLRLLEWSATMIRGPNVSASVNPTSAELAESRFIVLAFIH